MTKCFVDMAEIFNDSVFLEPNDPTSFVTNEFNMDKAMVYVKKLNEEQKDVHVTMTAVIAHAVGWGLYKMRRDVGHLRFGTFKADKSFGVTVLVDKDGGADLVPVTIWDAHKMTIFDVAKALNAHVQSAKKGKDEKHNKATASADFLPTFIIQVLSFCVTYIGVVVGIPMKAFGIRKESFGHVVITNVGTLGYNSAYPPICPAMHSMALICTGKIEKRPIVVDDKVAIANMMTLVATGDHRYGDAAIFIPFFKSVTGYIDDPANYDEKNFRETVHYTEAKAK